MTEKLTFTGIVQGIGFRPACQRIAAELNVGGQVKNSGGNVELIIAGTNEALDSFVQRLSAMFDIKAYTKEEIEEADFDGFKIVSSVFDSKTPFLTPDLATCGECEKELCDKSNRRYCHPFISCVNCGPRYTIMKSLPYDRENTAMADFEMCDGCKKEYTRISDRRCHAQTVACNDCGPEITMGIGKAVELLNDGEIIAVKGIGGYHLACRADNADTVKRLRKIKGRECKPFALMFKSVEEIKKYCRVQKSEEELLLSPARPIVLLEKTKDFDESVCKKSDYTGAFLPCNPIQIMLLGRISPLVMTSANISGEVIITSDEEINKFNVPVLSHNREILTPIDDSVLQINAGQIQFIRRARGYVPLAIEISRKAKCDTLLTGGDLKAVFGFHRDSYVFLSQHFGDLEDKSAFDTYKSEISRFAGLHGFSPDRIVCDSHPNYYSSAVYNADVKIQHHKAHIASVIAEHKLEGKVLGFAFDGTGYGDDGAVWGSEVILFDGKSFTRKEHLKYTDMPAGDEVSKNARLALECYLKTNPLINSAVENNINTVKNSSMGRLFDAVSALLGVCDYNSYEGQCAAELESCARKAKRAYKLNCSLDPAEILHEIISAEASKEEIALGFHEMLSRLILKLAQKYKIKQIALSGGVFNNRILTQNTVNLLEKSGYSVYINNMVPSGDGGIALGQAFISATEG